MPMQLKGLRQHAAAFRSALDDVGTAYGEGATAAKTHATEVRALADEFKDLKSDLDFAIGEVGNSSAVTGNGAGESEKAKETPKPPPVTFQHEPANAIQQPPQGIAAGVGDLIQPLRVAEPSHQPGS